MSKMMHKSLLETCADTFTLRCFNNAYYKTFELVQCDTPEQQGKSLRLRHKVFCEEYGYECPSEEDNYMEKDAYDDRSVHFVLRHRLSNEIAGTLRVILPNDERPGESFQAQEYCDHPLLRRDSRSLSLCEISRFCMAPRFRKRKQDGRFLSSYHGQDTVKGHVDGKITFMRRKIPYPQAALLQGAFETALGARIMDCLWMIEPDHLESLDKIGFVYRALGPKIHYHGSTQPIIFNIKHVLDNMRREARPCWDIISDGGRLQDMADVLDQNDWADSLIDDECQEMIYQKLSQ